MQHINSNPYLNQLIHILKKYFSNIHIRKSNHKVLKLMSPKTKINTKMTKLK